MSFGAKAMAYAIKQRARAKLQAAQCEFESLRDLAGLAEPEIRIPLGTIERTEDNPHGLGAHDGTDTGNPHNLPVGDALPATEGEDCPD